MLKSQSRLETRSVAEVRAAFLREVSDDVLALEIGSMLRTMKNWPTRGLAASIEESKMELYRRGKVYVLGDAPQFPAGVEVKPVVALVEVGVKVWDYDGNQCMSGEITGELERVRDGRGGSYDGNLT